MPKIRSNIPEIPTRSDEGRMHSHPPASEILFFEPRFGLFRPCNSPGMRKKRAGKEQCDLEKPSFCADHSRKSRVRTESSPCFGHSVDFFLTQSAHLLHIDIVVGELGGNEFVVRILF